MACISPGAHKNDLQVCLLVVRMGKMKKCSRSGFLDLKLLPLGLETSLIWETVLCIVGCLVVPLTSTY